MRVAVLEDDEHISRLVGLWLEEAGHSAEVFASGAALLKVLARESFDLLLLDWVLPDTTGDQILKWVRENIDWPVPVIVVSARDSEADIVTGLTLGADDYVTKPLRRDEFLARVGAVARRAHPAVKASGLLRYPPYELDMGSRHVRRGGQPIELTQKEYDLALFLFRNHGRLLSRAHILQSVWGHQRVISTRTVDTHMSRLRTKLGLTPENGWQLNSIYNHGYRLERVAA